MSLWTSSYADWNHDILKDVSADAPIEIDPAEVERQLAELADQLRPFSTPPGCTGCGGCRTCLTILP